MATTTETLNGQVMDALRQIDERLRRLEEQVAAVAKALPPQEPEEPWWKRIAGSWKDNPFCEDWARTIRRLREEDYAAVVAEIDAIEAKEKQERKKRKPRRAQG